MDNINKFLWVDDELKRLQELSRDEE